MPWARADGSILAERVAAKHAGQLSIGELSVRAESHCIPSQNCRLIGFGLNLLDVFSGGFFDPSF